MPRVRTWLARRSGGQLIEPFAGGASVSLAAVSEGLVRHAVLAEVDEDVAMVWQVMLGELAPELAERVREFSLTDAALRQVLVDEPAQDDVGRAFATLLRNRVAWAGITWSGGGLFRNGDAGRELRTRWSATKLAARVTAIAAMREQLTFVTGDGLALLEQGAVVAAGASLFLDPPYPAEDRQPRRSRLYKNIAVDHERLFRLAASHDGEVLMTYNDEPEVRQLAFGHGFDVRSIPTWTAHHWRSSELLIARDLGWLGALNTGAQRLRHSANRTRRVVASEPSAGNTRMEAVPTTASENPPPLVPLDEAARHLDVSRRTVERMVQAGKLERVRAGGRSFVTKDSLQRVQRKALDSAHTQPVGANAELVASIERLVTALREERSHLLMAMQEREVARVELAQAQMALEDARGRCRCGSLSAAA